MPVVNLMPLRQHTWKAIAPRWFQLTFPSVPTGLRGTLEELSEVPGVTEVRVGKETPLAFHHVALTLHETVFVTDVFSVLKDATGLTLPPGHAATGRDVSVIRQLRSYQLDGVSWLVAHGGGVLGDEMGLGKTTTAIVAAEALRNARDAKAPVFIVGPKFTRDVWRRELQQVLETPGDFFACEGRKPTKAQEQTVANARWVFCHYEILDGWRPAITRPLFGRRPVVAIFDEAHWLKNPRSKRGKSALALGPLCSSRIVLTGTPIEGKVNDLWPLLTLAAGTSSFGTYFSFAHRYTIHEKGTYGWTSYGTRRMPELRARIENVYLRRTIDAVGVELPSRTREQFTVESHGAMPKALKKWTGGNVELALDRLRDAFETGNLGRDTLAAITEWRKWTSESKVPTTVHLAASLLGEREHVVVFCWQRETAEVIAQGIRDCTEETDARVHVVHGDIEQKYRDATVQEFQESTTPMVIVATIDSLKEGVTLHRARRVIMHDLDWTPAKMLQAEARIHRLGQLRPTISTWMVVPNSVDAVIARHLLQKAEVINDALDDANAQEAFAEVGLKREDTSGQEFARRILDGV